MSSPISFQVTQVERVIAVQTLEAIDEAIARDGGAKFRELLRYTLPKVEDAYRTKQFEVRKHLGASLIGRECARDLWYTFRWATNRQLRIEYHSGDHHGNPCRLCKKTKTRMMRLLNRGHLEEARFVALLMMIGVEVWQQDEAGRQFKVSLHGGHFGGSSDSIIRGIPECPTVPLLGEYKTYNDERFSRLLAEGVRASSFEYYIQQQIYMGGHGLAGSLFLAVNKDDDELYAELIPFNPELFSFQNNRALKVIQALNPPSKIADTPGWWKCKICDHRFLCHKVPDGTGTIPTPVRSCRTCIYARPSVEIGNASWVCTNQLSQMYGGLSVEAQINGCDKYSTIEM